MIAKANDLNKNPAKVSFKVNENTVTAFKKGSFSFIYTTIVLQHIPYPQQVEYIAEFCRLLKPGGVLVFQIPTKDIRKLSLIQKVKSTVKVRVRQMNPIDENEIKSDLTGAGCEVLHQLFTNHTDVDFGGNLKFINREESNGYESSLFIARKL
jgi:SAM-dependent methyltransferase